MCIRDSLEEDRLQAAVRAARYQQALRRYHSRKVKARSFEEGDLVLRRVQSAKNSNKLTPKWEGPYRVKRVTRPGAVRLETEDGIPVSNSWNIEHLRKFFPIRRGCRNPFRQPPFVQVLPLLHVILCTKPGADPVHK